MSTTIMTGVSKRHMRSDKLRLATYLKGKNSQLNFTAQ